MKSKDQPHPVNPVNQKAKVVITGGGIAGLMSAYFVRKTLPNAKITVLEKGGFIPYQYGSSSRSAACSRQ